MSAERVSLVLIPRYTTLAGASGTSLEFTTAPMDVTPYSSAIVTTWRGKLLGSTSPSFKAWFEVSTDQVTWTLCGGSPLGWDPGENTQVPLLMELTKRWFRMRILFGGADNLVTCWSVGFLERRLP